MAYLFIGYLLENTYNTQTCECQRHGLILGEILLFTRQTKKDAIDNANSARGHVRDGRWLQYIGTIHSALYFRYCSIILLISGAYEWTIIFNVRALIFDCNYKKNTLAKRFVVTQVLIQLHNLHVVTSLLYTIILSYSYD